MMSGVRVKPHDTMEKNNIYVIMLGVMYYVTDTKQEDGERVTTWNQWIENAYKMYSQSEADSISRSIGGARIVKLTSN